MKLFNVKAFKTPKVSHHFCEHYSLPMYLLFWENNHDAFVKILCQELETSSLDFHKLTRWIDSQKKAAARSG